VKRDAGASHLHRRHTLGAAGTVAVRTAAITAAAATAEQNEDDDQHQPNVRAVVIVATHVLCSPHLKSLHYLMQDA